MRQFLIDENLEDHQNKMLKSPVYNLWANQKQYLQVKFIRVKLLTQHEY